MAFVLSGFAGLAYEIVWAKMLGLVFGVSSQAITTVLAAMMAGLALGSVALGRWADRTRYPLRLYAGLEIGIAASALTMPWLFAVVNRLYVHMARAFPGESWAFTAARFVLCFLALLLPTTLMGGTLPAISRSFVQADRVGRGVGLLYGANTLGGVVGCLAAGCLLLQLVGAGHTIHIAAMLNLVGAILALYVSARHAAGGIAPSTSVRQPREPAPRLAEPSRQEDSPAEAEHPWVGRFTIIAFGICGATSLAYEAVWTRVLIYFVDMTTHSFCIILATFLTGIALGSYCFAPIADRRKDLLIVFGLLELGIALSAVYMLQSVGVVVSFAGNDLAPAKAVAENLARVALLVMVPTLLMGATFPVVVKLYTTHISRLGQSLGSLYASNTVGGVAGSLTAGFVLLPALGAQGSVVAIAAVNGLLGALILLLAPYRTGIRRLWAIGIAMPCLLVGGLLSARIKPTVVYSPAYALEELRTVLYYDEGAEASLSVLGGPWGLRGLNINGKTTAYTDYFDITVHKMLAHLPLLLSPEPRSALIIGFGIGSTARSMACYPLERIDCAELVPEERRTAPFFGPENGDVLSDPRFRFITGDGRNHILLTQDRYDVISVNAIHPAYSPYLYTQEFYQLCRSRLSENGVMCAWVATNVFYLADLLKTFQSVFPHCSLWYCNTGHTILIGTPGPLNIDFRRWQERMSEEPVRENLAEVWLDDPVRLLSTMILDAEGIKMFSASGRISTDDRPLIEPAYFTLRLPLEVSNMRRIFAVRSPVYPYIRGTADAQAAARLARRFAQHFAAMGYLGGDVWYLSQQVSSGLDAVDRMDKAVAACPDNPRLRYERGWTWINVLEAYPGVVRDANVRARACAGLEAALVQKGDRGVADTSYEQYLAPIHSYLAIVYFCDGQTTEAKLHAQLALQVDPRDGVAQSILRRVSALRP